MTVLVVGSVALDSVETPFGKAEDVLGGSGTFFSASASHFSPVQLVGVIGSDYPDRQARSACGNAASIWPDSRRRTARRSGGAAAIVTTLTRPRRSRLISVCSRTSARRFPSSFATRRSSFSANIDPRLQLDVLSRSRSPKLVACDTMNFWIESRGPTSSRFSSTSTSITLNDGEARQLTEEANLVQGRAMDHGARAKHVIIKKGEHGAFMFTRDDVFFAPAYPLETVFDPTGAGDSFAGGFMGYLARTGDLSRQLRRAVVYGSAMGSFAVERFSIERLLEIDTADIRDRLTEFRRLVAFEEELPD